jgi:hypothetical protein
MISALSKISFHINLSAFITNPVLFILVKKQFGALHLEINPKFEFGNQPASITLPEVRCTLLTQPDLAKISSVIRSIQE